MVVARPSCHLADPFKVFIHAHKGADLERDPIAPFIGQFAQGGEGPAERGTAGVHMAADRCGAVGKGRAECKVDPLPDIVRRVIDGRISTGAGRGAVEGAVCIRRALPHQRLVQVGVAIDRSWPGHGHRPVKTVRQVVAACRRTEPVDAPIGNHHVGAQQAIANLRQAGCRHRSLGEAQVAQGKGLARPHRQQLLQGMLPHGRVSDRPSASPCVVQRLTSLRA